MDSGFKAIYLCVGIHPGGIRFTRWYEATNSRSGEQKECPVCGKMNSPKGEVLYIGVTFNYYQG